METGKDPEIDVRALVRTLWRGLPTIVITTVLVVLAGSALYLVVPKTYQSEAAISPLTQSNYAKYIDLRVRNILESTLQQDDASSTTQQQNSAFPYTRDDLFSEFTTYLQDPSHLVQGVKESGIALQDGEQETSNQAALAFVRTMKFTLPTEKSPQFTMRVRSGNEEALNRFVSWSLDHTRQEVAKGIKAAVTSRIEAGEKIRSDAIAKLRIEVASRREQQNKDRMDEMANLAEQAKIAASLGIENPVGVLAPDTPGQSSPAASAQVIAGEQPIYFQGSKALEEQVNLLRDRTDGDPFTTDLRNLERQIYLLENNQETERLSALLNQSPLNDPATAPLVEYSAIAASAVKVFPRISIFGVGSLLLGLLLGSGLVLLRTGNKRA